MARINDEAQWIVLIGFMVAVSLFFLAIVVSESTLVGQTTSEAVLDFSKANIQDVNQKTGDIAQFGDFSEDVDIRTDIEKLYSARKGVIINITHLNQGPGYVVLHYNDGITTFNSYNEEPTD
jgi:hypothetical protein